VQSLFDQCGVLRANTLEELFDITQAIAAAPLPGGRQVAIVTDAGGPAIMATDALPAAGLGLSKLSQSTRDRLRKVVPPEASIENPVDMIASADSKRYRKVLQIVLKDPAVHGAIVICVPPVIVDVEETAKAIAQVGHASGKPVLGVFMGADYASKGRTILEQQGIPSYLFPESAVRAFGAMADYARIRARPIGRERRFRVDLRRARRIVARARTEGRSALKDLEALELMRCYGVPLPRTILAKGPQEAIAAARQIGYPVVMKVSSPKVSHKTEVGGVLLDLRSDAEAFHAFHQLADRARAHGFANALEGVLVQPMVQGGQEVIVGSSRDPQIGPMVMFGLGGVFAEHFKDVNFRIAPLTDVDAREMVRTIKAFPLLQGVRGAPPSDVPFLEEAVLRVSQLVCDFPEVASLDLNPFRVFGEGKRGLAVDARVFLRR
jgi:acetyltransferase